MTTKITKTILPYGHQGNATLWATKIAFVAVNQDWVIGDFSKIVSEIQKEAFDAGQEFCNDNR